jgi:hypothetical protein
MGYPNLVDASSLDEGTLIQSKNICPVENIFSFDEGSDWLSL